MKLKTKFQDEYFRLGEVIEADIHYGGNGSLEVEAKTRMDGHRVFYCKSLKELNDLFEDHEEPKEYWYVSCDGRALEATTDEDDYNEKHNKGHKQIGNYFLSKEEAELAVRKLKAWKRLKDIGCRFVLDDNLTVKFVGPEVKKIVSAEEGRILCDDYRLLFGGEE